MLFFFSYPMSKLSPYPEAVSLKSMWNLAASPPTPLPPGSSHYLLNGSSRLLGLTASILASRIYFQQGNSPKTQVMSCRSSPLNIHRRFPSLSEKNSRFSMIYIQGPVWPCLWLPFLSSSSITLFLILFRPRCSFRSVPRICPSSFLPQGHCLECSSLLPSWFAPPLSVFCVKGFPDHAI